MTPIVFFGAGGCGRETLASCRSRGIEPVAFVDNDPAKWGTEIDGVPVLSPHSAKKKLSGALWVATVHRDGKSLRRQILQMGCLLGELPDYLPVMDGLPPLKATAWLQASLEARDYAVFTDQLAFRKNHDYDAQAPHDPPEETYFPKFIKKIENEAFVDCGAYDGDTVSQFFDWQPKPYAMVAFEPDGRNLAKLQKSILKSNYHVTPYCVGAGVGAGDWYAPFDAQGTSSSVVGSGSGWIPIRSLDSFFFRRPLQPTFIKMDIEGHELQALWGARKILKTYAPVLAVCAYHTSDHLWEIPLLIHAINPNYSMYLRRYADGARELVWYALPKDRHV